MLPLEENKKFGLGFRETTDVYQEPNRLPSVSFSRLIIGLTCSMIPVNQFRITNSSK